MSDRKREDTTDIALEYLLDLERIKFNLMRKVHPTTVDMKALQKRLRDLENDIATLASHQNSCDEPEPHSLLDTSTALGDSTRLEKIAEESGSTVSKSSIEHRSLAISANDGGNVSPLTPNDSPKRRHPPVYPSACGANPVSAPNSHVPMIAGSGISIGTQIVPSNLGAANLSAGTTQSQRKLSIGSAPLYNVPSAFQYGIKLKDTKNTSLQMYDTAPTNYSSSDSPGLSQLVQGSGEREGNVRQAINSLSCTHSHSLSHVRNNNNNNNNNNNDDDDDDDDDQVGGEGGSQHSQAAGASAVSQAVTMSTVIDTVDSGLRLIPPTPISDAVAVAANVDDATAPAAAAAATAMAKMAESNSSSNSNSAQLTNESAATLQSPGIGESSSSCVTSSPKTPLSYEVFHSVGDLQLAAAASAVIPIPATTKTSSSASEGVDRTNNNDHSNKHSCCDDINNSNKECHPNDVSMEQEAFHECTTYTERQQVPSAPLPAPSSAPAAVSVVSDFVAGAALEFCIVEADWSKLQQQNRAQGDLLTPLLPPTRSWHYPPDPDPSPSAPSSSARHNNSNTLELQDQSFFFPSGVKVDLVWPAVAALRSDPTRHIRHIVPFTDAQGQPTYACVLTISQPYQMADIAVLGDKIVPNLVAINEQKRAARIIQKRFRQWVAYRKVQSWTLHRAVSIQSVKTTATAAAGEGRGGGVKRSSSNYGSPAMARSRGGGLGLFRSNTERTGGTSSSRMSDNSAHGTSTSTSTGTGTTGSLDGDTQQHQSASATTAAPTSSSSSSRRFFGLFGGGGGSSSNNNSNNNNSAIRRRSSTGGTSISGDAYDSDMDASRNGGGGSDALDGYSSMHGPRASFIAQATASGVKFGSGGHWQKGRNSVDPASPLPPPPPQQEQQEQQQQPSQTNPMAEHMKRRVVVAQKAYCIISASREYTYIFKVLEAIAAAEMAADESRPDWYAFTGTLSSDSDDSDGGENSASDSNASSRNTSVDIECVQQQGEGGGSGKQANVSDGHQPAVSLSPNITKVLNRVDAVNSSAHSYEREEKSRQRRIIARLSHSGQQKLCVGGAPDGVGDIGVGGLSCDSIGAANRELMRLTACRRELFLREIERFLIRHFLPRNGIRQTHPSDAAEFTSSSSSSSSSSGVCRNNSINDSNDSSSGSGSGSYNDITRNAIAMTTRSSLQQDILDEFAIAPVNSTPSLHTRSNPHTATSGGVRRSSLFQGNNSNDQNSYNYGNIRRRTGTFASLSSPITQHRRRTLSDSKFHYATSAEAAAAAAAGVHDEVLDDKSIINNNNNTSRNTNSAARPLSVNMQLKIAQRRASRAASALLLAEQKQERRGTWKLDDLDPVPTTSAAAVVSEGYASSPTAGTVASATEYSTAASIDMDALDDLSASLAAGVGAGGGMGVFTLEDAEEDAEEEENEEEEKEEVVGGDATAAAAAAAAEEGEEEEGTATKTLNKKTQATLPPNLENGSDDDDDDHRGSDKTEDSYVGGLDFHNRFAHYFVNNARSNTGHASATAATTATTTSPHSSRRESGVVDKDVDNRIIAPRDRNDATSMAAFTVEHSVVQFDIQIPGYIPSFQIDLMSLLTTKEWTCAVLFTHLNSQIIFKIINLLLMEKSLIIHGKNAGIVTSITMAIINLISPFLWEGIFVPLVPDNARELFGAPVPLIVGTTSAPRVTDVSEDTAILFLNDDTVTATYKQHTVSQLSRRVDAAYRRDVTATSSGPSGSAGAGAEAGIVHDITPPVAPPVSISPAPAAVSTPTTGTPPAVADLPEPVRPTVEMQFTSWFVRLPEVSADMPMEPEMCRRVDYTRSLLCEYLYPMLHLADGADEGDSRVHTNPNNRMNSKNSNIVDNNTSRNHPHTPAASTPADQASYRCRSSMSPAQLAATAAVVPSVGTTGTGSSSFRIHNTIDSLLMAGVPLSILHQVRTLIVAIKRYNYGFCGCVIADPGAWKRFLRHSTRTGEDEFYPEYFMEPLRNHLEFQDAIVHTQLFVSFMDKLRKEQQLLDDLRKFISDWAYFRFYLWKRGESLIKIVLHRTRLDRPQRQQEQQQQQQQQQRRRQQQQRKRDYPLFSINNSSNSSHSTRLNNDSSRDQMLGRTDTHNNNTHWNYKQQQQMKSHTRHSFVIRTVGNEN